MTYLPVGHGGRGPFVGPRLEVGGGAPVVARLVLLAGNLGCGAHHVLGRVCAVRQHACRLVENKTAGDDASTVYLDTVAGVGDGHSGDLSGFARTGAHSGWLLANDPGRRCPSLSADVVGV